MPTPITAALASGTKAERRIFRRALAVALGVHLAATALFRVPTVTTSAAPSFPPRFRLAVALGESEWVMLRDPSLLALPSARGFSREALAQKIPTPLAAAKGRERAEVLSNLFADPRAWTIAPAPTAEQRLLASFDRLPPESQEQVGRTEIEPPRTTFTLTAQETERRLLGEPTLPLLDYTAPEKPTVLRLGINGAGAVVATLIERTCGKEETDKLAVGEVGRWRFAAHVGAFEGELDWLVLTIHWASAAAGEKP